MAQNAIPAPIMHALAEATDKAFEWAEGVAESGAQHPGRLAIAAEVADGLRGFGYEIRPADEPEVYTCASCGGPNGFHAPQCYTIERPAEVIEIRRGDGRAPYAMNVYHNQYGRPE